MVEKDAIRRSYDELAAVYAERRCESDRGMAILRRFLDSVSDSTVVLDAGCGQGAPVLSQMEESATAVGVDLSREQLKLAARNTPDASLAQGDMAALPFDVATFDAVVAYWSIIHVPMDDHQTVVDEFARVLRPGGRLLLCEGTTAWVGENPDWLDSGVEMWWNIAGANATRDQLQNAGFAIVDRWGGSAALTADEDEADDEDPPWTFFAARLEG